MKQPSRNLDQMQIRLPEGMRDSVAAAARRNRRSANAEVIAAIAAYLGIDTAVEPAATAPRGPNWLELTAPITLEHAAIALGRGLDECLSSVEHRAALFAVVYQLRRDFADAAEVFK